MKQTEGRFSRSISGYLPINLLQALIVLAGVAWFTRQLDPTEYGRYALANVSIQLAISGAFFWLHAAFSRYYATAIKLDNAARHLSTGYAAFAVLAAVIACIGLAILGSGLKAIEDYRDLIVAGMAALLARGLLVMGLETHRAAGHILRYSLLEGGQLVLSLSAGIALIVLRGPDASALLWGMAIGNAICAVLDLPHMARLAGRFEPSPTYLKELAGYGVPLTMSLFLGVLISSADRFFIAGMIDEGAVGIYAVAYALANRPLSILFNWIGMAASPLAFAAMEQDGPKGARRVLAKTANSLVMITLPAAVGLAAIAGPMAEVMVGEEFRTGTADLVPWFALATLLSGFMMHYVAHAYAITRRTRVLLATTLVAAGINIVLNIVLIPRFGLYGAATAAILAYATGLVLRIALSAKVLPIPIPARVIYQALAACTLMAGTIMLLDPPRTLLGLIVGITLGMVIYAVAALGMDVAGCRGLARAWLQHRKVMSS